MTFVRRDQIPTHAVVKTDRNMNIYNKKTNQKGYIALITALIIAGFIMTLMISFPLISTDALRSFLALKKGMNARNLANSCADISLTRIQGNLVYAGENLSLDEGSCIIEVSESEEFKRIIEIEANVDEYSHELLIEAEIYGRSIGILSWETI